VRQEHTNHSLVLPLVLLLLLLAVAGQEMAEALTPDVLKLLVRAASMAAAGAAL
jgi:hypothetical protein